MPAQAYLNRIATAVPSNDVHQFFIGFASSQLSGDPRRRAIFNRMADKGGIEHRFSCFEPASDPEGASTDLAGIFARGGFPGTAKRMDIFAAAAPELARRAVEKVLDDEDRSAITHLIIITCTGFSAPALTSKSSPFADCRVRSSDDHRLHGLLGRYQRPQQARHIVRSELDARVLIVNIDLCTLHLKETTDLEKLLSFCLWGDGCAASIVSADAPGIFTLQLPRHSGRAFPGGYGGMVWADGNRLSISFCIRRDALTDVRGSRPGQGATGSAFAHVLSHCPGAAKYFATPRQSRNGSPPVPSVPAFGPGSSESPPAGMPFAGPFQDVVTRHRP